MTDLSSYSDDELLAMYAMPSLIKRESGGRPGVLGPKTKYGQAQGMTQMLPETARATAARLGVPWRPELMTEKTPEAADYQTRLGQAYLQEGIKATGGLEGGLKYYHGGPNRKLWGPKTAAYSRGVVAGLQGVEEDEPQGDLSGMSDEELLAAYNAAQPEPSSLEIDATIPKDSQQLALVDQQIAAKDAARKGPSPKTAALLHGAPKPSLLNELATDAMSGFTEPFKTLGRDVGAAYDRSKARLQQDPFKEPVKTTLGDYAATAGLIGDVAALPGAAIQTLVRPAARQLAKIPAPMYSVPGFLEYGHVPRRLNQTERAAALEDVINTSLAGAAPARPKGAPPVRFKNLDELKAAKTAAYDAVDNMGVRYEPVAARDLSAKAARIVLDEGGAPLYPKADAMARRIDQVMTSPDVTLTKLDKLRAQIGERVIKDEPTMGYALRNLIDEFIDAADPATIAGGNGTEAAAAIRSARELNARFKKAEAVTEALDSADLRASSTYAGGNKENAIRQNVRPLIDPKSSQRIRNLTPAERAAADKVVRGSPVQNATRLAGKMLDPRGLLGAALQTGMGVSTGGLSAFSIPAGILATEIGKQQTTANANALLRLIASGGKPPLPLAPVAPGSAKLLSPAGIVGAGVLDSAAARIPGPADVRARAEREKKRKASAARR